MEDIQADYGNDLLFREDCLKNALYHHLRLRLGDGYFKRQCVRIFTEYRLETGQRADLAIVRVERLSNLEHGYLLKDDRILDTVGIIECKYLTTPRIAPFRRDASKVKGLCRRAEYSNTLFYLAQIQEGIRRLNHRSGFPRSKPPAWTEDRLTELVGCWGEGGWPEGMHFEIIAHTNLNRGIRYKKRT